MNWSMFTANRATTSTFWGLGLRLDCWSPSSGPRARIQPWYRHLTACDPIMIKAGRPRSSPTGAVWSSASSAHKRVIEHASQFWRGRRDAVFLFRTRHLEMSAFGTKRTIRPHPPLSAIGVNVLQNYFCGQNNQ
jgi:hypothetical protein